MTVLTVFQVLSLYSCHQRQCLQLSLAVNNNNLDILKITHSKGFSIPRFLNNQGTTTTTKIIFLYSGRENIKMYELLALLKPCSQSIEMLCDLWLDQPGPACWNLLLYTRYSGMDCGLSYKLLPVLEILLKHTIKLKDIVEHL